MRIRFPETPAREREGGLISAGMISTIQTPLPIFAETETLTRFLRAFPGITDDFDDVFRNRLPVQIRLFRKPRLFVCIF